MTDLAPPKRRHHITIDLHADTEDELLNALRVIANNGEVEGFPLERLSGGVGSGYRLTYSDAGPEMTAERFYDELKAWHDAKKRARA